MASILYIGFDRDDGLPGLRKDASLATADLDRISRAYAYLYFPNGVEETPADPETGAPAVIRAPTGEEVFQALVAGLLNGMLNNTISWEKTEAAKVAQDQVPPIPVEV